MKVVLFTNPLTQALGLMFRKPQPKTLYIFDFLKPVQLSFHMFFVFTPIDIYFLNNERKVVEIKRNFRPFQTIHPQKKFRFAIETAPNELKIRNGDVLNW